MGKWKIRFHATCAVHKKTVKCEQNKIKDLSHLSLESECILKLLQLQFAITILSLLCSLTPKYYSYSTYTRLTSYFLCWYSFYQVNSTDTLEYSYCKVVLVCFALCFNRWTLYALGQTANLSAKPCGLNFHRLGLPLIFICAYPRPQRVRFADCGAEVFPVLGSATSTEVLQSLQCLGCSHAPAPCYIQNYFVSFDDDHCFCFTLQC